MLYAAENVEYCSSVGLGYMNEMEVKNLHRLPQNALHFVFLRKYA